MDENEFTEEHVLDEAHIRISIVSVLMAWAFFSIALRLVQITVPVDGLVLPVFMHASFLVVFFLYVSRGQIVRILANWANTLVTAQMARTLNSGQIRANAAAIHMLRFRIRTNIFPKIILIFCFLIYVVASLCGIIPFSISAGVLLAVIFLAMTADEFLLAYRISSDRYGADEAEIRELLNWIVGDHLKNKNSIPPSRMLPKSEKKFAARLKGGSSVKQS